MSQVIGGFDGVWLVEHPCDAKTKKDAKRAGCKIIDVKFKDQVDPKLVQKTVMKPKPKTEAKPKAEE
jgi:hypothetical protein